MRRRQNRDKNKSSRSFLITKEYAEIFWIWAELF
jgi:hypothetical protein